MTTPIQLALEALKANHEWHTIYGDDGYPGSELQVQNMQAIAALSQPVQVQAEPVATIDTREFRVLLENYVQTTENQECLDASKALIGNIDGMLKARWYAGYTDREEELRAAQQHGMVDAQKVTAKIEQKLKDEGIFIAEQAAYITAIDIIKQEAALQEVADAGPVLTMDQLDDCGEPRQDWSEPELKKPIGGQTAPDGTVAVIATTDGSRAINTASCLTSDTSAKEPAQDHSSDYERTCDLTSATHAGFNHGLQVGLAMSSDCDKSAKEPAQDEREKFETWLNRNGASYNLKRKHNSGEYLAASIERDWLVWQARSALAQKDGL